MQAGIRVIKLGFKWCVLFSTVFIQTSHASTPVHLVSSNPINNASDVDRNVGIVLTFSANLNPATISASRVILKRGATKESIAITVATNQIAIQPHGELLPATSYTMVVTGIQSSEGEPLNGTVSLNFKTRDGAWQSAQLVAVGSQYLQSSRMAFNKEEGTAIVVWTERSGTMRSELFSSRYSAGHWSLPELVNTNVQGEVFDSAIAMGRNGTAVAVWEESDTDNSGGLHFRILASTFSPATSWTTPQLINTEASQGGFSPQVAIAANGRAIAVWYQYNRGTGRIFSSEHTDINNWSEATPIDAVSNAPGSFNPHIAFDNKGNAYAVWQQWWHGVTLVWGNRYVTGRGWIAPQIVQSDRGAFTDASQIAFDGNGNAVAVWGQANGVFMSRYTRGQGWSSSSAIGNANEGFQPSVAMSGSGDTFVAWTEVMVTSTDGHGIPHTRGIDWATHFTASDGWSTPTLLQDANGFNAGNVLLAADDAGNALAVWSESNGSFYRIYTNRYQAGAGWVRRKVIDTTNTIAATNPHIAIAADGNALAVWEQTDAAGNVGIWANRFE